MRVLVLLRSVFFVVILTAVSIFVFHEKLCINYNPHDLEAVLENCEESINSIGKVNPDSQVLDEKIKTLLKRATDLEDYLEINETTNSTTPEYSNLTFVNEWHELEYKHEKIRINAKTCFDFSIYEILSDEVPKYSEIVFPIRLTLILIVTSFLFSVLDFSSRIIFQNVSLIQCLGHGFLQIAIWAYILVNIETYRRAWPETWLKTGVSPTEIPMYPFEWTVFEFYAFLILIISTLDAVLYQYLNRNLKWAGSQGVYKIIQQE